jgi:hypothetical protein
LADVLHVIAAAPIEDVITGRKLTQIVFGQEVKLNKEIRERVETSGQRVMGEHISSNIIVMSVDFDGVVPYRIGSAWTLKVDKKTGEVSLKEAKS